MSTHNDDPQSSDEQPENPLIRLFDEDAEQPESGGDE